MNSQYPAHIRNGLITTASAESLQPVEVHCRHTATYAGEQLKSIDLYYSGYLAGLLHDCGKFTEAFRRYITAASQNNSVARGSVNHTFAGVRLLMNRYFRGDGSLTDLGCEALAIAMGGHHGQIDCLNRRGESGIEHRLTAENIQYEEAAENFFRYCAKPEELDMLFQNATQEMTAVWNRIFEMSVHVKNGMQYEQETTFYAGLFVRLLLSAVVDGDRRDTAEFMRLLPPTTFPDINSQKAQWMTLLNTVEQKLALLPADTDIDKARQEISARCRTHAEEPGGLLRLNAPTGGGKTLSSLRFALAHAAHHGKQRIIFVSPLLSILDQNAQVIRDYLDDDELILEHHSNVVSENLTKEALDQQELFMDTWDAPVIITTLVQFLNTLFSGKMSTVRRFHALCNSVIILDEVQTVPEHMLSLFNLAMNFLTEFCHSTVVLCSATQPCMELTAHPLHGPVRELLPYDAALWSVFHRTEIQDGGNITLEDFPDLARAILTDADSLLIICNKKTQAKTLFSALQDFGGLSFYLAADMCPKHRIKTLDALQKALQFADQKKVLCIATNVIEAGVDISFQRVIRFSAGMDSVVQAAGRCNRNGESSAVSPVLVVQCLEEKLTHLRSIQAGKAATMDLLVRYRKHPEQFRGDLTSDEAIRYYYAALYKSMTDGEQDYVVKEQRDSLFSMLSINGKCDWDKKIKTKLNFRQAFHLAGSIFQVYDQDTIDVIVPYEEGQDLIIELNGAQATQNQVYTKVLLDRAKPYTVALYRYQAKQLQQQGALLSLQGGTLGLVGHYDIHTGLCVDDGIIATTELLYI